MRCIPSLLAPFLLLLLVGCVSTGPEPTQVDSERAAEANARLGLGYIMNGNYEVALDKLKIALGFNPDSVNANHYMGELYRRLGRPLEAEKYYTIAIAKMEKDDSLLHNNFGIFLCSQGRVAEGVAQFQAVLDNPVYAQRAETYDNIGYCYQQHGDLPRAEESYRQALKYNPRLIKSLLAMARLTFDSGKFLSTRAYLQRYGEVGEESAAILWLGIRAELALADYPRAREMGERLVRDFPASDEAIQYQNMRKP
ncbi:MAG: type IV pilus biogenesis/stability protein PilW [Gammaproteobacteria bacterium]|nr:type IV pilus biogenesis/stability protein PilW [Gammaproteobacteria bacterium]